MSGPDGAAHELIERLRADLWQGVAVPPGQACEAMLGLLEAGLDYPLAHSTLWSLVQHGQPVGPAFEKALQLWDWSIDLARLAHEAGHPGAAALVAARVRKAGRRYGLLAWLHWDLGQPEAARAALLEASPDSPSWTDDLIARFEIALRLGDRSSAEEAFILLTPRLEPWDLARLRLMRIWMEEGAAALSREIALAPPPDHPAIWDFLFQTYTQEREFNPAADVLERLIARRPDAAANRFDRLRHALDREDPTIAARIARELPQGQPWHLAPRQLVLELRLALLQAERAPATLLGTPPEAPLETPLGAALERARAALRLWPRNSLLAGLLASLGERVESWDVLAAGQQPGQHSGEPLSGPGAAPASLAGAAALMRLGLPEPERLPLTPSAWPGDPSSLDERLRLKGLLLLEAGRPEAVLRLPPPRVSDSPTALWLDEPRIEALLWLRRLPEALARLDLHLARHPGRMGLRLQRARARLLAGDFAGSEADLAVFRALKLAHTGFPPPPDLRDHITRDALASGAALPFGEAAAQSLERLGPALGRHPGLAAAWLARPGALPGFTPEAGAPIPPRFSAYWEGPMPLPAGRGLARWSALLEGWQIRHFDRPAAETWLATHDPAIAALFARASGPAARADLFRAALMAAEGGIFADLDEYPRESPLSWLEGAGAVVVLESGYGTAANNFLAARPGHPLMLGFRAAILERATQSDEIDDPWWNSGPARLTLALASEIRAGRGAGLRILTQSGYCARISTNLPFPHKRGPDHWRSGLPRGPRNT